MSVNYTNTDIASFLKVRYPDGRIPDLTFQQRPLLDLLPKDESFAGRYKEQPVMLTNGNGASHTAATAFASTDTSQEYAHFQLYTHEDYANVYLYNKDIDAARDNKAAFGKLIEDSIEAKKNELKNRLCRQLYATGLGVAGVVGSISGTDITLTRARDHRKFSEGNTITLAATDGTSGAVRSGTTSITKINPLTGVLTCGTTYVTGSISGAAAADYIFISGDFGKGMYGLGSWLGTPTASESFYGLDRTTNRFLKGVQTTVAGSKVEGLIDASDNLFSVSDSIPSWIFVNPLVFAEISKEQQSIRVVNDNNGEAKMGFSKLMLMTYQGEIPVIADPWCPSDQAFMINKDFITLESMGPLVKRQMRDPVISAPTADAVSMRLMSYPVLNVKAPSKHGLVTFS